MKYSALLSVVLFSVLAFGCKDVPRDISSTEQLSVSQRCNKDTATDDPECRDMNPGTLAPAQPVKTTPPKSSAPTTVKLAK